VSAFAHIGGLPIEESLGSLGPAVLIALGVTGAKLRAWCLRVRRRAASRRSRATRGTRSAAVQNRARNSTRPGLRSSRRSGVADQAEFVVVTHWRSIDALQAFAGPDWQKAVIEPEEEHVLAQVLCDHYETIDTG
jgi:heme-degrading monooxygenase HmoA